MKVQLTALFGVLVSIFPFLLHAQERLQEVVVVSSRTALPLREITSSVSILDAEAIRLQAQPSLSELLRTQPSVNATNTGGVGKATTIRIRGEEGFRTLVLVDGMDISDPSAVQVLPLVQHLIGSHFDRVEILRGPQAFIYGADAVGSSACIQRDPKNPVIWLPCMQRVDLSIPIRSVALSLQQTTHETFSFLSMTLVPLDLMLAPMTPAKTMMAMTRPPCMQGQAGKTTTGACKLSRVTLIPQQRPITVLLAQESIIV